jgi:AcrR family transcriptional regulator
MVRRTATLKSKAPRPSPKREHLLAVAEALFDRDGFHATGVDRLVAESGIARMTFYKHFPTKNALVMAVLERRDARWMASLNDGAARYEQAGEHPVLAIFSALADWLEREGSHGCLILRGLGEFSGHDVTVAGDAVFRKRKLGAWMAERLERCTISQAEARSWDLILLIEGATALAPVVGGRDAAGQAAHAATALLRCWQADDLAVQAPSAD